MVTFWGSFWVLRAWELQILEMRPDIHNASISSASSEYTEETFLLASAAASGFWGEKVRFCKLCFPHCSLPSCQVWVRVHVWNGRGESSHMVTCVLSHNGAFLLPGHHCVVKFIFIFWANTWLMLHYLGLLLQHKEMSHWTRTIGHNN